MYSRRHKNGDVSVPSTETCGRSVQQKMGIEREVEQATNGATDYANRSNFFNSSNYMPEESKKAEKSTTSVDLLVAEAI